MEEKTGTDEFLQESDTLLQALASDEEAKVVLSPEVELEILTRAYKDLVRNAQAWENNLEKGKGKDETNKAGALRYRNRAAMVANRIEELKGGELRATA